MPTSAHPAATLLKHAAKQEVPISIPQGIIIAECKEVLRYGTHISASKEVAFFHKELFEKFQAGHTVVFPLSEMNNLTNL